MKTLKEAAELLLCPPNTKENINNVFTKYESLLTDTREEEAIKRLVKSSMKMITRKGEVDANDLYKGLCTMIMTGIVIGIEMEKVDGGGSVANE